MAVNLSPVGGVAAQFFTNTGAVLTGGKLYTYAAGTTTPAVTYTSSNGLTAQPNPIVLDAAGRVPNSGEIWLTDGINYKFLLKDSNDVLIATYDNISGINSNSVSFTNQQQIVTATAGQTVFNLSISYQPATNSLSVFVDGVNQYGPGAQYAYTETSSTSVTFTNGLHVGAVVKFTTTQQQGAGAVDASQVSYTPGGTGAVTTNVQTKLRQTVSVKDFGAVGDGVTNDTAAVQAAITSATANKNTLIFPTGTYKLIVTQALELDLGVMSMVADGNVTLDFSSSTAAGQYALWIYSSLSYPVSHYQNTTHCLQGFVCIGAGAGKLNGLLVYHPTYTSNCQFKVDSCSFYNFDSNMYVEANAWRVSFINCVFLTGHDKNVLFGPGANQGESITFSHCMIADGGDFQLDSVGNQINLYSTSILNTRLWITGSSNTVNMYGGNLENPGSALAYQYVRIEGTNNKVTLFGTPITINPTTWTSTLFYVISGSTLGFSNVTFPDINNYNVAATGGYSEFVSGTGRVVATGSSHWPVGGGVKPTISSLNNALYNGDFETGTTAGWTVTPYGTAGSTAVASATAKKFGNYGLLATSVAGGGVNITQTQACLPNQLVTVFAWVQLATATSGSPWDYVQTIFKSADGTTLTTYGDGDITVGTWDQLGTSASKYAPVGTASVTLTLNVQPGGNVVYFDNIVMNIV